MPILQIGHLAPDFEACKEVFDSEPLSRIRSGVRRYRVPQSMVDQSPS
jgi:hypothetical protein